LIKAICKKCYHQGRHLYLPTYLPSHDVGALVGEVGRWVGDVVGVVGARVGTLVGAVGASVGVVVGLVGAGVAGGKQ